MKFADLVRQATTATSTATVTLGAAPAGYRTLADAITQGASDPSAVKVGDTMCFCVSDAAGNKEVALYTVTAPDLLTRQTILESSNAGAAVAFPAGTKDAFCTVPGAFFASVLTSADGLTIGQLAAASSIPDTYAFELFDPATGTSLKATVAALKAVFGGTGTVVDNPPTLSALSASATGSTTATGSVTTNETGGTLYWLFSTASTATAAQVKAGQSKTVTATGAQTLPGTGLTASTPYYLHVLHRDTLPQDSAVLSLGASFTTQAAGTPTPTVTGVTVTPSTANVAGGGTVQLSAAVAGANSPSQAVNWTIVGGGSVSASGLVTAPAATSSAQTLTVTATSQQDGTTKGTATITVAAATSAFTFSRYAGDHQISSMAWNQSITSASANSGKYAGAATDAHTTGTFWSFNGNDGIGSDYIGVSPAPTTSAKFAWGPSSTVAPLLTGDWKDDRGVFTAGSATGTVTGGGNYYSLANCYIAIRDVPGTYLMHLWAQIDSNAPIYLGGPCQVTL